MPQYCRSSLDWLQDEPVFQHIEQKLQPTRRMIPWAVAQCRYCWLDCQFEWVVPLAFVGSLDGAFYSQYDTCHLDPSGGIVQAPHLVLHADLHHLLRSKAFWKELNDENIICMTIRKHKSTLNLERTEDEGVLSYLNLSKAGSYGNSIF
jgi:hypothetical protein